MKVKELKRTVNVAWSPTELHPACLAAGSAAQQVDASFSSNASLEIYGLNFEHPGTDLELKCSLQTQHKFQKIVWSGAGIIVGGCDGGLLQFYSAERLLNKAPDALLGSSNKHNGHVSALDINPYQKNLLASGASDSEIFIWDLNNTSQPMAPGNRSQPLDHVQGVAWNHQVQHILGSTFATRCVVWDLRKNEPIMKLSDSQSRTRWRSLAWHPAVATQLCIASEDDQGPVIQLWDLRLAASPLVTLEGHQKGVMAVSWCRQDPDLLLSAGKDGRVLCWNPNNTQPGGELLLEVSQQQQWVFDVAWSPRHAGVLVSSSFDQEVAVHSLLGGSVPDSTQHSQSNIMDSFGGLDSFSQLPAVQRAPPPPPAARPQPPRAPRWLKRPVAAKFAFGGKLVSFERCPQEAGSQRLVHISQVVSEPEIVERALSLDAVLGSSLSQDPGATERLAEYCRQRGDEATQQSERYTWYFLRANFMPTFRSEALSLLGFKQEDGARSRQSAGDGTQHGAVLSRGESTETEAELSTDTSTDLSDAHTLIEKKLASMDLGSADTDAVVIPHGGDSASQICRALVCGQLEQAVDQCLEAGRVADALVVASLGSQELLFKVQQYHLMQNRSDPVSLIAHSLLRGEWDALVRAGGAGGAGGGGWRAVLAALVTHTDGVALQHYAEMLGDKLSKESEPSLNEAATICYLCGMSPDALVSRWAARRGGGRDAAALARLTELALLVRRAALARGRQLQSLGKLESVLIEYASRLAAQGCLHSALNALEGVEQAALRERLHHALGLGQRHAHASASATHQQPSATSPPQYGQPAGRTRTVSGHSAKRGHVLAHNDVSHTYSAVPAYEAAGPPQPSPWGTSSVAAAPPPLPPQPARPPSAGPAGGLTSRSKYKVDPSVQSAPLYNQYSYNPPPGVGGMGGYNSPLPDPYGSSSVPAPGFAPVNPIAGNPTYNPPVNPSAINPATLAPSVNGGYYGGPPPEPAAPAAPARPVPPGWNDPPILASSKPKPKQEVQAQAPITHPLFGVEPPQHIPLNPAQQYPGQQYPDQQQYGQQQYPGQQYGGQQYPAQQQYQGQFTPAYPQQAESPAPVAEPAAPAPKPPLPEEHLVLQTVLDALRADCAERASNPQMKRKLEDVQKRLDTLYDMLRDYRLSESALSLLHSCVQCARAGDWEHAAHAATALASGADFAAAASFLPGLKVLLQLAQQLQVCAR